MPSELGKAGVMFRLSESAGEIRFTGRPLGQDNEVYAERLGLGSARTAELRAEGVI